MCDQYKEHFMFCSAGPSLKMIPTLEWSKFWGGICPASIRSPRWSEAWSWDCNGHWNLLLWFCLISLWPLLWDFTSSIAQKTLTITFKTGVAFGFRVSQWMQNSGNQPQSLCRGQLESKTDHQQVTCPGMQDFSLCWKQVSFLSSGQLVPLCHVFISVSMYLLCIVAAIIKFDNLLRLWLGSIKY